MTYFVREAIRRFVNGLVHMLDGLTGWMDTVSEEDSMLLEVSAVPAAVQYQELCLDMLPINPKLILIRTHATATVWQRALTNSWKIDPTLTGEKLKHRPSKNASGCFAQIGATAAQLASAKARKGHAATEV